MLTSVKLVNEYMMRANFIDREYQEECLFVYNVHNNRREEKILVNIARYLIKVDEARCV
jgi:hypothetical protein